MPTTLELMLRFKDTVDLTDREQAMALVLQVNQLNIEVAAHAEGLNGLSTSLSETGQKIEALQK